MPFMLPEVFDKHDKFWDIRFSAFHKTVKLKGQEYDLKLVDTAGQVSVVYIEPCFQFTHIPSLANNCKEASVALLL